MKKFQIFLEILWVDSLKDNKEGGSLVDVLSYLMKRVDYKLSSLNRDEWFIEMLLSDEDEVIIILPSNSLNIHRLHSRDFVKFFEIYSLKAMFDMKNPYSSSDNFTLYVFSRGKVTSVMYGIYKESMRFRYNKKYYGTFCLVDELPDTYFSYIDCIENYMLSGNIPADTENYEFGVINMPLGIEDSLNPNYYNKTVLKVRSQLKKESTVLLKDVASVLRPHYITNSKEEVLCCLPISWKFPLDNSSFRLGKMTDVPIKKGDILFFGTDKMYIVYKDIGTDIHVNHLCIIVRPNTDIVSSEYLYLYLKSDTAKIIMASEWGNSFNVSKKDIENFKIILPTKKSEDYEKIFYTENFPMSDIEEINKTIFGLTLRNSNEGVEDILNSEFLYNLKLYRSEVREKIIEQDLNELNICFMNKAYKATLILAGSILEAILIDWLSELHGRNYFEEEYIDKCGNRGSLAIYIREIKYLKRPGWLVEAEKANLIRNKRNMVHAKLCLNSDEVINEKLCREVIGYLVDVIRTRNGLSSIKGKKG